MEENAKNRILELEKILNEANYHYYVLDHPTITDQEFVKRVRKLRRGLSTVCI